MEIMEDLKDLKTWIFKKLQLHLGSEIQVDLDNILIEGDSAGENWLTLQKPVYVSDFFDRWLSCYSIRP